MPVLPRAEAVYRRLADAIRDSIIDGTYPTGSLLPSEAALSTEYGVSRPTVRQALAALRTEGLLTVQMGKGSFVRAPEYAPRHLEPREDLVVDPPAWRTTGRHRTRSEGDPTVDALMENTGGPDGKVPYFVEERTYMRDDPATTKLYRRFIPFTVVEATGIDNPYLERAELDTVLTGTYGPLNVVDYVGSRMPTPDEAATLTTGEGTPVIETVRVTYSEQYMPVLAEVERVSAAGLRYAYALRGSLRPDMA